MMCLISDSQAAFDTHLVTHSPCAASLAGIPPGGLGLSELVHEKAHPSVSKFI